MHVHAASNAKQAMQSKQCSKHLRAEVDVETDISGSSLPLETTATTFSTSEGPHHVVSLPIQRTDVREQGESEAMRCFPFPGATEPKCMQPPKISKDV